MTEGGGAKRGSVGNDSWSFSGRRGNELTIVISVLDGVTENMGNGRGVKGEIWGSVY